MLSPPINLYASFQRVPPAPAMRREKHALHPRQDHEQRGQVI